MDERVVDEIPERLLEAQRVAVDAHRIQPALDADLASGERGAIREPVSHRAQELVQVDPLGSQGNGPLVGPGDQQQVFGQAREPLRLLCR